MALTKGVRFASVRAFVTERFGPGAWNDALRALEAADRDALAASVPVGWYDLALYARLVRAVDARFGAGDLELVQALGRYDAERDLKAIQRLVLKLFGVASAIAWVRKRWARAYDTGAWTTEVKEREVVARLSDLGVVDAALCRGLAGYLARALELAGAEDVVIDETRCRARGEPVCEFHARFRVKDDAPAAPAAGGR
ncbi:MAG TPA: V4R domain-containing protein [Minicystis sp.]|nr:V4R domain-containing protein [Minicystis sp.]